MHNLDEYIDKWYNSCYNMKKIIGFGKTIVIILTNISTLKKE